MNHHQVVETVGRVIDRVGQPADVQPGDRAADRHRVGDRVRHRRRRRHQADPRRLQPLFLHRGVVPQPDRLRILGLGRAPLLLVRPQIAVRDVGLDQAYKDVEIVDRAVGQQLQLFDRPLPVDPPVGERPQVAGRLVALLEELGRQRPERGRVVQVADPLLQSLGLQQFNAPAQGGRVEHPPHLVGAVGLVHDLQAAQRGDRPFPLPAPESGLGFIERVLRVGRRRAGRRRRRRRRGGG